MSGYEILGYMVLVASVPMLGACIFALWAMALETWRERCPKRPKPSLHDIQTRLDRIIVLLERSQRPKLNLRREP